MFGQLSLGNLGLILGSMLTIVGIGAYVSDNATLNLVGFFYGLPLILGGLALKTSELKPIAFSVPTSPEVMALRKQQATLTQNKLRRDVTRYCYGQNAHLERALQQLGLTPTDASRPVLIGIREQAISGAYALVLEFESPQLPLASWLEKQEKMTAFFGPDLSINITQLTENRIEVKMIAQPQSE
jgi:hypothetical protein